MTRRSESTEPEVREPKRDGADREPTKRRRSTLLEPGSVATDDTKDLAHPLLWIR